ncbi:polymorphic toxin-type HINT domain-containing protein [Actinoplanes sp. NPDC051633]|uniref:polymorphic toxin-type HINT domain-containing protein n=1 Tax=Actinoplanes sp. NPDC051633 TaxID=3155670 RepID=UPI00342EF7FA
MASAHVLARARWLAVLTASLLTITLAPPVASRARAAEPGEVPKVTAGRGPQQRPVPAGAASVKALSDSERPPVMPPRVRSGGAAEKVSTQELQRMARAAAPGDPAFTDLVLQSGFVLGDTSLVAYFNVADDSFDRWRVDLFDATTSTRQESTTLDKAELGSGSCGTWEYCRSFGAADGWTLDAERQYFITITALFDGGGETPSAPSGRAQPRNVVNPPDIPARQAAGCGCSGALGMTDASQAIRAIGVNTGTGAFTRTERDLAMKSFGVTFTSTRSYSSLNGGQSAFGPGWAWVYDMRVTESEGGAVVRAEDGSEVLYTLTDGAYQRPAGVRSTLRRAGTGWELVTRRNIVYAFDAQGRLASILNPRQVGLRFTHTDKLITIRDASGHQAEVKVDAGLIREIELPDHREVSFEYTNGLLTKVEDARGEEWKYRYDTAGRLAQVIDPFRVTLLTNEYDATTGRAVKQTDALGKATTFLWRPERQEAETTDADGVTVWDGYKGNVLLYSQRGNGDVSHHRYDGTLNRNLVVNGNQNQHESRYDPAGNLVEQFAPQRRFSEKVEYDARNNPTTRTDADGNKWVDRFNEFDELVESTDAEKHKISYTYDNRGIPLTITDQRGKVTTFESIPDGRLNAGLRTAEISPEGRRSELGYDKTGRRTSATDPRGTLPNARRSDYTSVTSYDAQDRTVATLEAGKRDPSRARFDKAGRLESRTTPEGVTTRYTYLDNNAVKAVYEPRRTVKYTYTDAGRRATSTIDVQHGPDSVTSWAYNAKGLVESVTSPRGNVPGAVKADFTTTYVYDKNDNIIQIRRPYPGGVIVTKDFKPDDLDRTTETIDEFGEKSSFERGNRGEVRSTTDSLGRKNSMEFDKNGRQTGIRDAKGAQTKSEYDPAGNKIKEISPTGGVTTFVYTDDGLLASVTEPRGNVEGADKARFTTRFEYDPAGNRVRSIDPLGNTTSTKFDASNRTVLSTDARGNKTHYTYNQDNQTRTVTGPDARFDDDDPEEDSTLYSYGDDGMLEAVRDPKGHRTELHYDEAGRLIRSTDPLGRSTYVSYDVESNRTQNVVLARNEDPSRLSAAELAKRTTVDTYDIVGRRDKRTLGSEGPVYTWGYDAKDRVTSYGDPTGVRAVVYDNEDQIKTVTRKEAGRPDETFTYTYDERGNVETRQYADGTRVSFGYDAASRITSLTAQGGSAGPAAATWGFGYDVAGRRTSTTLPAATGLTENRSYDDAGRLTAIGTERTGDPVEGVQDPVSRYDLTLDQEGNPTRVVTTRGGVAESVAYAYDEADRLKSACYAVESCSGKPKPAGRIDYEYDLVGNRTEQKRTGTAGDDVTEYEYDAADQLVEEEVESDHHERETEYAYDVRGNQIKAGGDRFRYNLDNTVSSATVNGRTSTFAYDATGLRLSSTTATPNAATTTQRWSWDVAGTLPQIAVDTVTDPSGAVLEKRGFTYGPDDEPLALLDPASGAHSYTHDWLGGIANMLSPTGTIEKGYDYDPFGNPRVGESLAGQAIPEGPGLENPMQFHGAYQDSSTGDGNYFMRARNYNPGSGRFATRDPMPTGVAAASSYVYGANNPMAYSDPTGLVTDAGPTTTADPAAVPTGPSPEELAKANQLQSKSTLDVILEAGGQILMEFLGINDIINCLKGDLLACVSMIVGALPWGKIFKAKKIAEAIYRAGKAVITFFQELKWAKAIIAGAEKAAEAAKAAAAAAAKAAAEKAAAAKAAAEAAAKKVAAEAAAKAKALAAKAKAKTKKGSDSADGPSGCHSFVAGTRVLLADGSAKPISRVRPGDTVFTTDPVSGDTERKQVTRTIRTDDDKSFVKLSVKGGTGKNTITTTDNHPFWSATRGRWVDAGDLRPGEMLKTSAGTSVQVGAVKAYRGQHRTFDLTVDGIHTYYVVAGDTSVLVHNTNGEACRRAANGRFEADPDRRQPGEVDEDGMLRGTNEPGFVTSRPSLRTSVEQRVWNEAEVGPNGGRMCRRAGPNCTGEVMVAPGSPQQRDWDYGHDQGDAWSNTQFPPDVERPTVIDRYHQGGGVECIPCNRGAGAD